MSIGEPRRTPRILASERRASLASTLSIDRIGARPKPTSHQLAQRAAQIHLLDVGKESGRKRCPLDGERLPLREEQSHDHDDRFVPREPEGRRRSSTRGLDRGRDHLDARDAPLVSEAGRECDRLRDAPLGRIANERATCPADHAAHQPGALELAERLAHGHPADPERFGESPLGGQPLPDGKSPRRYCSPELFGDRHVQRSGIAVDGELDVRIHPGSVSRIRPIV